MEAIHRWSLVTAVAPVAWGANYVVTQQFLPAGHPLWGATIRALPAGLLLLSVTRRRPRGAWWWRSAVLGTLNVAAFFVLVYLAAQLLPSGVAATVMASSPLAMMLLARLLLGERPRLSALTGGILGLVGVVLLLAAGRGGISPVGVGAAAAAMLLSATGFVLAKRWSAGGSLLASTAWQLTAGGLLLLPVAALVEGAPPAVDLRAGLAFAWTTVVATAVAFAAWYAGLRRLPAGTVGLIGLLNPITGVLLGVTVAGESSTPRQVAGMIVVFAGILLGQVGARRISGSRPGVGAASTAPGSDARSAVLAGMGPVGP